MGHNMVPGVGLVVVEMGEAGGVAMSEPQRPPGVSVMDSVAVFASHEFQDVILNDRGLAHGCGLSAGSFTADAIAESENVLVLVMLESVSVDINSTVGVGETGIYEP